MINALNSARIAVTGGAGFIGSHLVDALLRARSPAGIVELVEWFRDCGKSPEELLTEVAATNWTGASVPV